MCLLFHRTLLVSASDPRGVPSVCFFFFLEASLLFSNGPTKFALGGGDELGTVLVLVLVPSSLVVVGLAWGTLRIK
jgi:hypothetical protein